MMDGKILFNILIPLGIIILGYLLRDINKQKFYTPIKSSSPDHLINVKLLGTNDLHSTVGGLGLKSYPGLISGGYSKIVELIKVIR